HHAVGIIRVSEPLAEFRGVSPNFSHHGKGRWKAISARGKNREACVVLNVSRYFECWPILIYTLFLMLLIYKSSSFDFFITWLLF
ncbi:unnamed protein product, partial [Larinioides sclopetarius]